MVIMSKFKMKLQKFKYSLAGKWKYLTDTDSPVYGSC